MSEFDVILGMDWLTTYRVVIDCERMRVTAYTQDGTRVIFQGNKHVIFPQTVYESRCQGQLAGWLASLTLEDEASIQMAPYEHCMGGHVDQRYVGPRWERAPSLVLI